MSTTRINAAHIIATRTDEHRHLRDGVVVLTATGSSTSASRSPDQCDETIDVPHGVVTPGFINTHAHLAGSPLDKSFIEDVGPRQFYLSGLFEYLPVRSGAQDAEADVACLAYLDGRTAAHRHDHDHGDRSPCPEAVARGEQGRDAALHGSRAIAPALAERPTASGQMWSWDEDRPGTAGMKRAIDFIEQYDGQSNGRDQGLSFADADRYLHRGSAPRSRARPPTRWACRWRCMLRNRSTSSTRWSRGTVTVAVEWLESIDFLGPNVILGHAIILAGGSLGQLRRRRHRVSWPATTPTSPIASGSLPGAGSRWSRFARYTAAGVNMTLGTDTAPQTMIEALRWTAVCQQDR